MASSHTSLLSLFTLLLLPLSLLHPSIATFSDDFIQSSTTTSLRTPKTTHLHFYFQDRPGGENPTAVPIIRKEIGFGTTFMIDDALTEELDRGSKVVGRAQGMYSVAAQNDIALLMVVTYSFTEGKYNGSSISVLGRNHVADGVREMPVVGGSGRFRFGRGYALARTLWFDPKTGDASVEYNVTVTHF